MAAGLRSIVAPFSNFSNTLHNVFKQVVGPGLQCLCCLSINNNIKNMSFHSKIHHATLRVVCVLFW